MTLATAISRKIVALRATVGLAVHRCARYCDVGVWSKADSKVLFDDVTVVPL